MTVYVIAQLRIYNPARYEIYVRSFLPTLAPFEGALLAADDAPQVVEGTWTRDKVVLLGFADRGRYEDWLNSDAYQRIIEDRHQSTDAIVLLISSRAAAAVQPP